MIPFLLLAAFLLTGASTALNKRLQLGFRFDASHFLIYNLLNALLASINFLISLGFHIEMNGITFVFSLIYGLVVILSLCLNVVSLKYLTIPLKAVMSSAGSLVTSSLFGFLVLQEAVSTGKILAILAVLAAVLLPWLPTLRARQKVSTGQLLLCLIIFIFSGISGIVVKLYAITPGVCDNRQFFLMTNLIIAV